LSVPLETLFVLLLAASLLSSSGLSSLHPDIITLPLTPDIITLVPHCLDFPLTYHGGFIYFQHVRLESRNSRLETVGQWRVTMFSREKNYEIRFISQTPIKFFARGVVRFSCSRIIVLITALLLSPISTFAQSSPPARLQKATALYGARSGASWPMWMAKDGGYYRKQGLDVELVFG